MLEKTWLLVPVEEELDKAADSAYGGGQMVSMAAPILMTEIVWFGPLNSHTMHNAQPPLGGEQVSTHWACLGCILCNRPRAGAALLFLVAEVVSLAFPNSTIRCLFVKFRRRRGGHRQMMFFERGNTIQMV